jgi:hypothetical protein
MNSFLTITNEHSKYRLKFGKEFQQFLEARDQVLEHKFDFDFNFDENDYPSKY